MKLPLISARRALAAIEAKRARAAAAEVRAIEAVRDADTYARRLQIAHHATDIAVIERDALRARVAELEENARRPYWACSSIAECTKRCHDADAWRAHLTDERLEDLGVSDLPGGGS